MGEGQAVNCAILCVDEMIKILMDAKDCSFENAPKVMFLVEVKEELIKIK